jgi:hypothetical protein
MKKED